jgi:ADP-ribose pyrophosphatase
MKILGEGHYVRLLEENGYEFAERKGCTGVISVVAVTDQHELVFVEQFRPAVGCRTIELVAGLAGWRKRRGASCWKKRAMKSRPWN